MVCSRNSDLAAALLMLLLAGCSASSTSCPDLAGKPALTAELYFGRSADGVPIDDATWQRFLADAVTPRFPAGFTVLDGHGQWRSPYGGGIIAEPASVVVIVTEPGDSALAALDDVRADYQHRFHQESVGLAVVPSCASF